MRRLTLPIATAMVFPPLQAIVFWSLVGLACAQLAYQIAREARGE